MQTNPPDTLMDALPFTLPMAGMSAWRKLLPLARKSTKPPEMEMLAFPSMLPMPGTLSRVAVRTEPPSIDTETLLAMLPMAGVGTYPSLVASTRAEPMIFSGISQIIAGRESPVATRVPPVMATAAVLALRLLVVVLKAMPVVMSLETRSVLPLSPSKETTGSVAGGADWLLFVDITVTPLPLCAPFRLAWAFSSVTMETRGVPLESA